MAKSKMKIYTLDEVIDRAIGAKGTPERDEFDHELNMVTISHLIREARKKRKLTQGELGKLVGVRKSQISKLENSANSATIETILRVFKALKAEVNFNIKMGDSYLKLQ